MAADSFDHLNGIVFFLTRVTNYTNYISHIEASLFIDKPHDACGSIARVVSDS